ncbi:malectin domain-containing carbohydrate-binding protein [Luteolibacter luteus]|uniref:Fibronectin type-III domain-containing protein n=1 Tax=Luteolibacter luteus TaxID=2728835 RepID=A0A858RKQ0_9BACT|nr:malectin domain-containing carbohydrate-binding protein [Luteolibacter luteus]QJE97074.1 hypothetical protein HHL09_15190 [Luteolibacter luteus]
MSLMAAAALLAPARAQVGFSASTLGGLVSGSNNKASKVTSLQFGPDNRLYFTQVNGTIIACDVTRSAANNYVASNAETISLVKNIPNYDDDGVRNFTLNTRQATGILVVGTAASPIIYVSSSDPREGAGSGATDLNLDTNSGIISRLKKNSSGVWEKVDIVRGLPRSEENHASNGLNISPDGNTLFLAQGGNTNAGGPSNNFAFSCETALSAAVLSVNLAAINAMPVQTDTYGQQYVYNLPTVNDPNPARAHNGDGSDVNDPFGGNDGLNQARLVQGGPVQVFASGFRNPYDVLIAKTGARAGKMYTVDNAANSGWGGYPKNEGSVAVGQPSPVTNQYVSGEPGAVNNLDSLQLISQGYYGGHPNPIRANPSGAGWLRYDGGSGGAGMVYSVTPTSDWPPVPAAMADPRQGDFKLPGAANNALFTNSASTTGLAEYTANNFSGAMLGNIIATQYSSNTVQRLILNADGTQVTGSSVLLQGSSYGTPLDVACPGAGAAPALAGTIFVGHHSSKITVLEPSDFENGSGSTCTGAVSYALDEDNDGYSNADEAANNSDPCSSAVTPLDRDGDFLSDLLDTDDDNDGVSDSYDPFPIDSLSGASVGVPMRYDLFNELGIGFFGIGFTGVMIDPGEDYRLSIDESEIIAGGTAGLFTDPTVGPGNPHGANNSQMNAFQFGVNVDEATGIFRVRAGLGGLLFNGAPVAAQSQGIFIGNGDQDNYLKIAVNAASGAGAIEIVHEENGTMLAHEFYSRPNLFSSTIALSFLVDPIAGTAQPGYSIGEGAIVNVGPPIVLGGKVLASVRGKGMAVGLLATTGDASTPTFNATWDYFEVTPIAGTAAARLTINSGSGSILTSSTNSGGSFQVQNLSTGGQKITSIKVDVSTAALPDVVFDPAGTAGDTDGKGFTLDSFTGTGTPVGTFAQPHDGSSSQDGYEVLNITFPSANFAPGNEMTFSSDIDPTSVKGSAGPGPGDASSVTGLELSGTTVTVTFSDGTVRKVRTSGLQVSGYTHSNKTSVALLTSDVLPTPKLTVVGKTSPFVANTQPTVRVAGPVGSTVKVWVLSAELFLEAGGYDVDPFEANNVTSFATINGTVGVNGYVDLPVVLKDAGATGGINFVAAQLLDASGRRSSCSDILVIDYDPTGSTNALIRVNAGGPSYVDSNSQTWAADNGFTSGSTSTFANPIAGTVNDAIYQTFRYDDTPSSPLDYSFPVTNGQYEVRLHFAETWSGVTAVGQRIFDVFIENQLAIDNLDVFAVAGANTAYSVTLPATVTDGQLTIGLRHVVQNPFICGIEVFSLGTGGLDTEPPAAPATLNATSVGAGSITLGWPAAADNVGVTGYKIFREGVEIGASTSLSFTSTGLTPSTQYHFSVKAVDASNNISAPVLLTVSTTADTQNPTVPGNLKGVAGNQVAILSWTASTDDAGVTGYRIYRDTVLVTTVTGLGYTDGGLVNGTLYNYQVRAIDASGKNSAAASVSVRPRALGSAALRIDVGSAVPFVDSLSQTWQADTGFNTGITEASTGAIAGTVEDGIYQTRRFDRSYGAELKYSLPLPDGEYELRLHFAEVWSGANGVPGARVFDVKVEDQLVLDNFDIFATAGFATALVVPIPVTVTGGNLTIEFFHGVNNPTLAGIEVYALEGPPPDTILPSTPGSFAVTGKTQNSISLGWNAATDNVGVTGYRIKRGATVLATVPGLNYTDTGLSASTLYQYSVVALDAAGNASVAATTSGTTAADTTPPSMPGMLTGNPGNGIANLTWTASTDNGLVTGYRVYRNGGLLGTVTTTAFSDSGLTNGTAYTYEVRAVDSANNVSTPASVVVTPRALGDAIVRVNAGSATSFLDPAGHTWVADTGYNTGYMEATTNAITGTDMPALYQSRRIDRISGAELKYQLTVPNGDYEVRLHFAEVWPGAYATGIRVFDVLMEGALAINDLDVFARVGANRALVIATPVTVADGKLTIDFVHVIQNPNLSGIEIYPIAAGALEMEPPTTPGNLAANNVTENSIGLGWTASTDNVGVTGYRIYRNALLVNTVTGLSFNDTGLSTGTLYNYSVIAVDAAGNTSPPALVSATTTAPDLQGPSIPQGLVATAGLTSINLDWEASTDNVAVTGYRIIRNGQLLTTVTTTDFADSGLPSGVEFGYEIIALDASGNLSSPAQVTTSTLADTAAPSIPGSLAATPSFNSVSLVWTASTDNVGVIGYRVYRGAELLATIQGTTYEDTGLVPGTALQYHIRAIDLAGNASAAATATTATPADNQAPTIPGGFEATPGDETMSLTWQPSADNVGVAAYEIRRNGILLATVPIPGFEDSGLTNGVLYTYEVRAIDGVGNVSAPAMDSAKPRIVGNVVKRINSGGLAYTDTLGRVWEADTGFSSGSTNTSTNAIAGTDDDTLYQTERYDPQSTGAFLEYNFALANGQYEVRLHFAETYSGVTAPGQRLFDVFAENNLALDDFDIFAHAGLNRACVITFPVVVADGSLNLRWVHGAAQNPKVCAIEVYPIQGGGAQQTFEQWLETNGLAGQTTADSDGGTLDNFGEYELQMDPNDPSDDLEFSLRCSDSGNDVVISLPELKPLGNYHLHRSTSLNNIGNVANRVETITRAEIEAMTVFQRQNYGFEDTTGGSRGFYRLYFEPAE